MSIYLFLVWRRDRRNENIATREIHYRHHFCGQPARLQGREEYCGDVGLTNDGENVGRRALHVGKARAPLLLTRRAGEASSVGRLGAGRGIPTCCMYMYIYVCMYIYVYMYAYICMYVCMYVDVRIAETSMKIGILFLPSSSRQ